MAGINSLKEIQEKKGDDFLKGLLNHYVIINEKVDGAYFGLKKEADDSFRYFKKSGEIKYIDRVLTKYYNSAIEFFEAMPLEKRQRIPKNFYFGFQYFSRGDSNRANYKLEPQNGLVLAYVQKLFDDGQVESTIQNREQLSRWAKYLQVEAPPVIFEGYLNDEQKTAILDFVYTKESELLDKFKTNSFTKFIIKLLNDGAEASFLREDLDRNIDSVVFRFYDTQDNDLEEKVYLAKLVDPIFHERVKVNTPEKSQSQDYIWLIVLDLMNHIETYAVDELIDFCTQHEGKEFDEKYVLLINKIFKDFIDTYAKKYDGLLLELPEYLNRPEFDLDENLIKDNTITILIKNNETYREIYKVLLNFFRRNRKKSSAGFFTKEMLIQLNLLVDKIRNIIAGNKVYEGLMPSFGEFIGSTLGEVILSEHEAAALMAEKKPQEEVNLLIGSFQPVSMGHIKAAEALYKKNGKRVILVAIKPEKPVKTSPFSMGETRMFLDKTQQSYPEIIHSVKIIKRGGIEEVLKALDSNITPLLWGSSPNKIEEYAIQLDYIKKRRIPIRLNKEFKLVEIPSYVESKKIIDAIEREDFEEFKKLVPACVSSQFFNLNRELNDVNRVNESEDVEYKQLLLNASIALNENLEQADPQDLSTDQN
jgi:hypothetical protein